MRLKFLLKCWLSFFLSGLFFVQCANAALNLELTQGVDGSIPIAIFPFNADPSLDISRIISHDLSNSGYFKVVNAEQNNNNFAYWRSKNIDNLLAGQATSNHVNFTLTDVVSNNHQLLNKNFNVQTPALRRLAHHISDLVYEKLTGIPGIFSTRIAYVLVQRTQGSAPRYMLVVADADGYNPKPILVSPQPIMSPRWSPDGRSIAYVTFEHNKSEIYISNVFTGQRRLVTSFPGINGAPAWSPDGTRLAVVLSKTGKPKIYVLNLVNRSMQQVTSGIGIDTEPSWSPNGNSIIFTSDRGGNPQIYESSVNGGQVRRLTFNGNYNARASFTPDGKQIVLLHRDGGRFSVAIQDYPTGSLRILSSADLDESPSVAPNGKMVLFATQQGSKGVLGVVSTDGRIQLRLPSREGNVQEPAWSPFLS